MNEDEEKLSPRQVARRKVKQAGRRSSEAAHTLMLMPEYLLRRLEMEEGLRVAFLKAREFKSSGARRREERRLAGVLRQGDIGEIEQLLASQEQFDKADARLFKQVVVWRTRLIDDDRLALDDFHQKYPGQEVRTLDKMVHEARREQLKGKPKGAKKALFRHIATVLKEARQD